MDVRPFLLAAALAGCLAGPVAALDGTHDGWTSTTAQPWVTMTTGCGFCTGNVDVPEIETTVLYGSGEVLWFRFGSGPSGGPLNVTARPGLEAYLPEIREVARLLSTDYVRNRSIKVDQVTTGRLSAQSWSDVQGRLASAEAAAANPGEPRFNCMDCSGPHVQLFGAKKLSATLHPHSENGKYGNYSPGDPWDHTLEEMRAIHEWALQPLRA